MKKFAFTLIELLVVISIIAITAIAVWPAVRWVFAGSPSRPVMEQPVNGAAYGH